MATKDVPTLLVLRAVAEYRGRDCSPPRPLDLLQQWTGQPEKVCYRAMEREEGKGFLDYGVGLYIGWLTVAGKAELAKLEAGAVMTKTVEQLKEEFANLKGLAIDAYRLNSLDARVLFAEIERLEKDLRRANAALVRHGVQEMRPGNADEPSSAPSAAGEVTTEASSAREASVPATVGAGSESQQIAEDVRLLGAGFAMHLPGGVVKRLRPMDVRIDHAEGVSTVRVEHPGAIAPGMVDGIRHAANCACLHTPAFQVVRRPCSCGAAHRASRKESNNAD